jgi:AcrR family transcriptional regulator
MIENPGAVLPQREIKAGRPQKEAAEALGDHVVEAASQLFRAHGYAGTSMTAVAALARVGKQTLYRRFPDKAALFREVVRRRADAMLAAAEPGDQAAGPLDSLKALLAALLDAALGPEMVSLYRIIVAEAASFPELAASILDYCGSGILTRGSDLLRNAQSLDTSRGGDPETMMMALAWAMIGGPMLRALAGESPFSDAEEKQRHLETIWAMFRDGIALDHE